MQLGEFQTACQHEAAHDGGVAFTKNGGPGRIHAPPAQAEDAGHLFFSKAGKQVGLRDGVGKRLRSVIVHNRYADVNPLANDTVIFTPVKRSPSFRLTLLRFGQD